MRHFSCAIGFAMLLWPSVLAAQSTNYPPVISPPSSNGGYPAWGWDNGGTTPAGSYLQGFAAVVRAQGDYNLSTSAAAVNYSAAARQAIQNEKDYVEAYFAIRAFNRQARDVEFARERQLTQDWLRFHPSMKPKRLTSSELDPVSGTINWPILLLSDSLASQRETIQKAFVERHQMGVMGHNNYRMVQQITSVLIVALLDKIQSTNPGEYIQAKRFIEALAFEASLPLG